jgi:hypothetical protein
MQRTVLRGVPLVAQPQPARLRCRPVAGCGVRCGAGTQERLGAAQVKKVAVDGTPKGEVTLALHTAKESVAVGLVHRYLTLVRQNARRCVFGSGLSADTPPGRLPDALALLPSAFPPPGTRAGLPRRVGGAASVGAALAGRLLRVAEP